MKDMSDEKQQRGIQSVEVGAQILEVLAGLREPVSLKDLADTLQMSSARIFPYLVSLVRAGIVSKDNDTGMYVPGGLAQELGILGLHYLNPASEAEVTVRELSATTEHVVVLSVWGGLGPTVVRMEESRYSLFSEIRLGSVMSLLNTSLGQIFMAWMPEQILGSAMEHEALRGGAGGRVPERTQIDKAMAKREQTRRDIVSIQADSPAPGVSSISAPVFGLSGNIVFALTLFDHSSAISTSRNDPSVRELIRQAGALSSRLGFVGSPYTVTAP